LRYGRRDVDSCDVDIHHFNIILSLLFLVTFTFFFLYILQIGIGERRPNQRY